MDVGIAHIRNKADVRMRSCALKMSGRHSVHPAAATYNTARPTTSSPLLRSESSSRLQNILNSAESQSSKISRLRDLTLEIAAAMHSLHDTQQLLCAMQQPHGLTASESALQSLQATAPSLPMPPVAAPVSAADRWRKARTKQQQQQQQQQAAMPNINQTYLSATGTAAAAAAAVAAAGAAATPCKPLTWELSRVDRLAVIGLGSLGVFRSSQPSSSAAAAGVAPSGSRWTAAPGSRAAFRLHQLALSLALADLVHKARQIRQHEPGSSSSSSSSSCSSSMLQPLQPEYIDPAFDDFDADLIHALGGRVVSPFAQPHSAVSELNQHCSPRQQVLGVQPPNPTGPWVQPDVQASLLYMPCCTRQLYGEVIHANLAAGCLHKVAILGTSFSSLHESGALFRAVSGLPPPPDEASVSGAHALSGGTEAQEAQAAAAASELLSSLAADHASVSGSHAHSGGTEAQEAQAAAAASELLSSLAAAGAVVELACPDFEAHGVAMGMHFFPEDAVQRYRDQNRSI